MRLGSRDGNQRLLALLLGRGDGGGNRTAELHEDRRPVETRGVPPFLLTTPEFTEPRHGPGVRDLRAGLVGGIALVT